MGCEWEEDKRERISDLTMSTSVYALKFWKTKEGNALLKEENEMLKKEFERNKNANKLQVFVNKPYIVYNIFNYSINFSLLMRTSTDQRTLCPTSSLSF